MSGNVESERGVVSATQESEVVQTTSQSVVVNSADPEGVGEALAADPVVLDYLDLETNVGEDKVAGGEGEVSDTCLWSPSSVVKQTVTLEREGNNQRTFYQLE